MQRCLIFNPTARGDKAKRFRTHLDALSADCVLRPTACAGDARVLAARAAQEGFQTIIAGGGDGTVNEVLNGIGDVPGAFSKIRFGVLPLGTVNVCARELEIPLDWRKAWQVLLQGNERTIDLPCAEFTRNGQRERRYFIQLAGAGLDSRAIELVNWELKKKIGPVAYVVAGLQALREPHPAIRISAQEQGAACSVTGELVLLGNGRLYGGNFVLFPKAKLQDGLLDACLFPKVNWLKLPGAALGLITGCLHRMCPVRTFQSKGFTLESSQRVLLELDGENVGELPATISLVPAALRVIVPISFPAPRADFQSVGRPLLRRPN